jgi:putative PIN family toxin of toxin-antitoxin system
MIKRVVIDANVVVSLLIGSKSTYALFELEKDSFFAPEAIFNEVDKNKSIILKKTKLSEFDFYKALKFFEKLVKIVKKEDYEFYLDSAKEFMKRDVSDAHYLACAFCVKADFIWTNDKDFSCQSVIPIKSTRQYKRRSEIIKYLNSLISRKFTKGDKNAP